MSSTPYSAQTTNPEQSLREAFAECAAEDAYSGGARFGAAGACGIVQAHQTQRMTSAEAKAFMFEHGESLTKHSPFYGIELAREVDALYGSARDLVVPEFTVDGDDIARLETVAGITELVAQQAGVEPENLPGFRQPSMKVTRWKHRSTTTPGKAVTRYFVLPSEQHVPHWENGYGTMSEARASLKDMDARWGESLGSGIFCPRRHTIVALTRRENGDPLVIDEAIPEQVTVSSSRQVVRDLLQPASVDRTQRGGWLIYGWF